MIRVLLTTAAIMVGISTAHAELAAPKPLNKVEQLKLNKVVACTEAAMKKGAQYESALIACDPTGRFSKTEEEVGYDIHPAAQPTAYLGAPVSRVVCHLPKTGRVVIEYRKDTLANVTFGGKTHVYSPGSYFLQPNEDDSLPVFFVKGKELGRENADLDIVEKGRCK